MTIGHQPQNMVIRGDHTQTRAVQKQAAVLHVHKHTHTNSALIQQSQISDPSLWHARFPHIPVIRASQSEHTGVRVHSSVTRNAHRKLYIYCVNAEQESLTHSSSNLQTWRSTSARLHTSQRKHTSEDISSFLYVPPNKSGPHCGGFYCAQPTLGTSSLHTLLTWNTAVAILSQCVWVSACVCRSSLSLFGVFLCPPCVVVFFCFFLYSERLS